MAGNSSAEFVIQKVQPGRNDAIYPQQIKKHSAPLRLWHWLNATAITGSLLTVLLNSTLFKTRANAAFIKTKLTGAGAIVTDQQARAAAHAISDRIWQIHIYCGYTLGTLLLFRLVMEFFQLADQKFIRRLKGAWHQFKTVKKYRELAIHEFWVKTIYAVFYLMLLTMVLTGLCLVFEDDVPLLKSIHAFRQIHSFTMYLILAFIVVHLAGVFLAERTDSAGIVSDMINGGKE
jgi:Ni/Fe-hydrogenase 1 B-type cytochrome subunit